MKPLLGKHQIYQALLTMAFMNQFGITINYHSSLNLKDTLDNGLDRHKKLDKLAQFATTHNLHNHVAFRWWIPQVTKHQTHILKAIKYTQRNLHSVEYEFTAVY